MKHYASPANLKRLLDLLSVKNVRSESACPNDYNRFMAAKQGKKIILQFVLSILPAFVAAPPLNEEIRSQKSEFVLCSLIYEWRHKQSEFVLFGLIPYNTTEKLSCPA